MILRTFAHQKQKAHQTMRFSLMFMVARDGIEPPTRGFSVLNVELNKFTSIGYSWIYGVFRLPEFALNGGSDSKLESLLHQSCTKILRQIRTGLQQHFDIKRKNMTTAITLLTEEQAREIAEQAAIRAVTLLMKNFEPSPVESPLPEIMTLKETAEYLKCSTITVYRKVKNDGLPVYRRLGHPRFIRFEIEKWLKRKL